MSISRIAFTCLIFFTLFSCTSEKNYIYFQSKNNDIPISEIKYSEYKVKPKDVLYVKIIPLDQNTSFSLNTEGTNTSASTSDLSAYLNGYTINDSGYIFLPMIGKLQIKDMILSQCQSVIQKKVDEYLKNSLVVVKLINFNVTVLGEVNKPGTFRIANTRVSLLEALGLAGDITINGNRKELLLVRNNIPGKMAVIDLTDKNIISSEYYYLMPDDVIYVKPVKSKFFGTNPFPFSTVISSISTFILILNFISKN